MIGSIANIAKRIRGTYIPMDFKDKNLEKEMFKKTLILLDYSIFDLLKLHISKKYKNEVYKSNLTDFIKSKTGNDVYEIIDYLISVLKLDNLKISLDPRIKDEQVKRLKQTIDHLMSYKSIFKKLDDNIKEYKLMKYTLSSLSNIMKDIDPRRHDDPNYVPKRDTISTLKKGVDIINKSKEPKELDDLLDKVSKYGIESLSDTLNFLFLNKNLSRPFLLMLRFN